MNAMELFRLVAETHKERGWGRALRTKVAAWYSNRPVSEVAADILKCPEHDGWTHRDLLRLAHPKPATPAHNALFQWAADGEIGHLTTPDMMSGELRQVYAVDQLKKTDEEREALRIVEQFSLSPDMLPYEWKQSPAVWETLLTSMNCRDIVENLTALADSGLLVEESAAAALVVARLMDRRGMQSSGLNRETLARARGAYARHPQAISIVVEALDSAGDYLKN